RKCSRRTASRSACGSRTGRRPGCATRRIPRRWCTEGRAMRHRKSGRKLGRNSAHRKAMYRNMAASLLTHETIKTTLPKAKELRRVVEPLITLAKEDGVSRRRLAFDRLRDDAAVGKLFNELGPRFKDRPGGYLRILKMGFRAGDSAPMAVVQLLDQPSASDAAS